MLPRPLDVGRVGIQAVDQVSVGCPQRGRQPAVAAAEVYDQAAVNPGGRENF